MRLSRAMAISNRTAPRSDASGGKNVFRCFGSVFWFFGHRRPFLVSFFPPKARRRRRPTAERSDSKSLYLAIDASSEADSFEIGFVRLSAFQFAIFCWISTSGRPLNSDFESTSQNRDFSNTLPENSVFLCFFRGYRVFSVFFFFISHMPCFMFCARQRMQFFFKSTGLAETRRLLKV